MIRQINNIVFELIKLKSSTFFDDKNPRIKSGEKSYLRLSKLDSTKKYSSNN